MPDEIKARIRQYLEERMYINLGTVCADGTPLVHTVGFVTDGDAVCFMTDKRTRKAQNIVGNKAVAFTSDKDEPEIPKIQGVQMTGRASKVTDAEVVQRVMGMIVGKYPIMAEMPPNENYVVFRVEFKEGIFIDNTKGFGHRDCVGY
ncbi:hypothetical protein LCGC14_1692780 [marine sediment metagenome]|uniref:Pyridoxamine 5'-phosphate oxidase N-terminal domain-containing protein n=1 Tax=marine sediment metagenome TaxID=412755 RepID=A0A0F9K0T8_9ZZZZ